MADLWQQSLQGVRRNDPGTARGLPIPISSCPDDEHQHFGCCVNLGWYMEDSAAGGTVNKFQHGRCGRDCDASATTGTDHFGNEIHYGDAATSYVGRVATPTARHGCARRGRVVYADPC
jgi:hypothetical protein